MQRIEPALPPEGMPLGDVLDWFTEADPDTNALVADGQPVTRRQLSTMSVQLAYELSELGVDHDDLVTIRYADPVQFVAGTVATWKVGATPMPVSARLPRPELDSLTRVASPAALIGSDPADEFALASIPVGWVPGDLRNAYPGSDQPASSWKAPTSGGSTGVPKLILSTEGARFNPFHLERWKIRPGGTLVIPAPLYHNAPFQTAMYGILGGGTVVVSSRFDAQRTLLDVERHRADWLYLVPTMMSRIWRLPSEVRLGFDLSSLTTLWHLAAPCPRWLKQAWIDWLGPDRIWELYAATEAIAYTAISGREWLAHPGSVGKVAVGLMRILDDNRAEVEPGDVGEIFMHPGPDRSKPYRYIGAEAVNIDGWESVGDLGFFDDEGYLYLEDRKSDMILVGGANVYPAEVEAAIERHPGVVAAIVVGVPDDDLGQRVHAVVQAAYGVDADAIRQVAAAHLAPHKVPRTVQFVDEPLRDDVGKARRSEILSRLPQQS
jgi:bile acid-coenzyme A ligase